MEYKWVSLVKPSDIRYEYSLLRRENPDDQYRNDRIRKNEFEMNYFNNVL